MIVRPDGTYEVNFMYPDSNWYEDEPENYVVEESTPEGLALAEKIIDLYPAYDLVIVDGVLVDVTFNQQKQDVEDTEQDAIDNDPELTYLTLEELGLDQVDNTRDMDKPVSTAMQEALDFKVDKEFGKGLSTLDFTTTLDAKLRGIEEGANNYSHPASHPASMITGLAPVATSGDYNALINAPEALPSSWEDIEGKPVVFPPEQHEHDARYYTQQQIDTKLTEFEGGGTGGQTLKVGSVDPSMAELEDGDFYFQVEYSEEEEPFIRGVSKITVGTNPPIASNLEEGEVYFYYGEA